jgi:tRNA-dihydrouridine synthase
VPSPNTFAAIDVNLACPVKKIARKARGGHWLGEPEGAIRILEAVREAVPADIPVTVKMRRAFDETPEMRESFYRIFDAAYDTGCAWVTVHARTVAQKYVGPSRWDMLREIVQRAHPGRVTDRIVFGSGDVWEAADVFRMLGYCSGWDGRRLAGSALSGVSVARGCIGNPWIFRRCRDLLAGREPVAPTIGEQRSVLEAHFALAMAVNERIVKGRGEARRVRAERFTGKAMRKFGIRFSQHHPRSEEVRKRFIAVSTLDEWRAVLDEFYGDASGR